MPGDEKHHCGERGGKGERVGEAAMAEEVGVVNPEAKANDIKVGDDRGECAEGSEVRRYAMAERHVEGGTEHRVRENCRHLDASVSG